MIARKSRPWLVLVLAGSLLERTGELQAESYVLPSSAFRTGANGAEYRTDVRLLNQGTAVVTVTAAFYDQVTSTTFRAAPFPVAARTQVAYDNVLQSLFGRTLDQGAYGPIRFEASGPVLVASSVNNVNACGTGAVSGQWLPAIAVPQALKAGVIGQLAVSTSTASGYRTNLVWMNPGSSAATATVKVRRGGGALLSTGTVGPLPANGFSQVPLDDSVFPGLAGTSDTNLWLEFTSDQPLLAYATVIHNVSGDPFAVVASTDAPGQSLPGSYILPSSAYRTGANGAEYRTDVRLLNQGTADVTVTATFHDQVTSSVHQASPFPVEARSQAAYDNILQSLFGRTLDQGAYGPIRFEATGPVLVASSVNNVNACGTGAVSGQWLPAIAVPQALKAGVIGQLAVSASTTSGYRTNLVCMNPGSSPATATARVRRGGGPLLSTGTIGPLPANGFSQVPLDGSVFPEVTGTSDTNLWLELTSDQPLLAYATVIHNVSGDPFAVVATADVPVEPSGLEGAWQGTASRSGTLQLMVDDLGSVTGSGVSSRWTVDDQGKVTGAGTVSWTSGSQLISASATWALQLDATGRKLSGTLDVAYSGYHDQTVTLDRYAARFPKWSYSATNQIYSSPAVAPDGSIYVGTDKGDLLALTPGGTTSWKLTLPGTFYSSPAIGPDGTIYIGTWGGRLFAVNPDGTKKWESSLSDSIFSTPSIGSDGTVYVGCSDNKLYAFGPDGTRKWSFATEGQVRSSAAIGPDGTIHFCSRDRKLYAVDASGTKRWEFDTGTSYLDTSPALGADGTVYVGSSKLYAIGPDGSKKWEYGTGGLFESPAIGADGTIYVNTSSGSLHAVGPDGTNRWTFKMSRSGGLAPPAIGSDGTIYIGTSASSGNAFYALNPDGTEKWRMFPDSSPNAPTIVPDGTLYVSSYGKVYAFDGAVGLARSPWPMFLHDPQHTGRRD